jgi:SIR2-like domain
VAPPTKISEAHWTLIVKRIEDRDCVPFLGAGVNSGTDHWEGLPSGAAVALRLAEDLTGRKFRTLEEVVEVTSHVSLEELRDLTRVGLQDLARVSLHVQQTLDQPYLMDRLREVIRDRDRTPPPLLDVLARLDLKLIVTSNYDRLMERALDAAGTEFLPVHQPTGGFDERDHRAALEDLADWGERLTLYKIHGTFLDGEAGVDDAMTCRPIVTEEDYIEFLTVAAIENRGVPNVITKDMVTSTLLFLGYSLEDWDFRTIFKGLIEALSPHHQRQSFALQKDPPDFWVRFWQAKGVDIYNVDLHEFALELGERTGVMRRDDAGSADDG